MAVPVEFFEDESELEIRAIDGLLSAYKNGCLFMKTSSLEEIMDAIEEGWINLLTCLREW